MKRVANLALFSAVAIFFLMVAGNLVRVSGSAAACPDWPTCFGSFGLPDSLLAQINYAHRALALIAALITAAAWLAAVRTRAGRLVRAPLAGAAAILLTESALGGVRAWLPGAAFPAYQPLHMTLALAAQALAVLAATAAYHAAAAPAAALRLHWRSPFARASLAVLALTFAVLLTGIRLTAAGAYAPAALRAVHMGLTGAAGLGMAALLVRAWRTQRSQVVLLPAATASAALFLGQAMLGPIKAQHNYPLELVGLHAAVAAAVWASLALLASTAGLAGRSAEEEAAEAAQPVDRRQYRKDLLALTKPIIVLLLLVTTYAGMVVGGKGIPSFELTFWTMLAGAMAAGGSGAINQYIDRELDTRMQRTAKRPIASGRMTPAEGLAFGTGLLITSFFLMAGLVNLLAALLSLAGMVYYVLLYSVWLKKATTQNIVIGGGAGAIPPLVGWAAAAGRLDVPALFLFAIVFLWTPPHFWALALVRRTDYARAGVPMLPVIKGEQATRMQIFIYTLELVGLTILMPVLNLTGSLFLVAAVVLGGALIAQAFRVLRKGGNKAAWMMYRYSSMYLMFIFVALVIDVLVS